MSIEVIVIAALAVMLGVTILLLVNSRDKVAYLELRDKATSEALYRNQNDVARLKQTIDIVDSLKIFDGIVKRGDQSYLVGFRNYINRAGDVQLALLPTGNTRTDYLSGLIGVEEAYNRYVNGLGVLDKTYIGTNNGTKIVLSPSRVY